VNSNDNGKNSFGQRTLENASDPLSIIQSAIDLTKEIVDDLKDTPKTREMKNDINLLIDAINMPIMHNLININVQMCTKYPEIFDLGMLIRINKDALEGYSLDANKNNLIIIVNCIRTVIVLDKAGIIAFDVAKTTASHFADAAATTLLEGWK